MKILLQVCCAPCFLGVIERLMSDYKEDEITLLFYNPNIYPKSEYQKRLDALKSVLKDFYPNLKLIVGKYDVDNYYKEIAGLELEIEGGKRCDKCIYLRMEYTAKMAKIKGYDAFTTTLSVSPHKNYQVINKIGQDLVKRQGITFIDTDFKKKDGFLISTKRSKELGVYRQNYCGCEFSIWE